jgi:hypothetical protein
MSSPQVGYSRNPDLVPDRSKAFSGLQSLQTASEANPIHRMGTEMFHVDRQTDLRKISHFLQFC